MEPVTPFDWQRIFVGAQPPLFFLEIILRVILIYSFTVFMIRFMGKRGHRQITPFELVLVISLGSATGDSMFYPEVPILYAWLIITLMVGLNRLLYVLQVHNQAVNNFLEGNPRLIIKEGKIIEGALEKENLRREEFIGFLREQGLVDTGDVEYAFLEPTGRIGFLCRAEEDKTQIESTYPETYEK